MDQRPCGRGARGAGGHATRARLALRGFRRGFSRCARCSQSAFTRCAPPRAVFGTSPRGHGCARSVARCGSSCAAASSARGIARRRPGPRLGDGLEPAVQSNTKIEKQRLQRRRPPAGPAGRPWAGGWPALPQFPPPGPAPPKPPAPLLALAPSSRHQRSTTPPFIHPSNPPPSIHAPPPPSPSPPRFSALCLRRLFPRRSPAATTHPPVPVPTPPAPVDRQQPPAAGRAAPSPQK